MLVRTEQMSEGVYLASGCYTGSAVITQRPEPGRDTYVIQVNCKHAATDGHHSTSRRVTITFNQTVTYVSSAATTDSGSGSATLSLVYDYSNGNGAYHNNAGGGIGLGDLVVKSEGMSLAILKVEVDSCNKACDQQHTW